MAGSYSGTAFLALSNTFTLVGTGATFFQSLAVTGNANVTLRDVTTTGMIQCNASGTAQANLRRVNALNLASGGAGVVCLIAARESEFTGDVYLGYNTVAEFERSRLQTIYIVRDANTTGFSFRLTNSVVRSLDLSAVYSSPTNVYVAYNTFFNPNNPGVACGTDNETPVGLTFLNNIFYSPGGTNAVTNGGTKCLFDTNVEYPESAGIGLNAIVLDPQLIGPASGDFHLAVTSPAKDASKSIANEPAVDFDGTRRPQGARNDIGAFEQK